MQPQNNNHKASRRPSWHTPFNLLILMTIALHLSFASWRALLNNFAVDMAGFTGAEIGIVQALREIPGFLAFGAVFLLLVWREQTFALLSLCLMGIGTAITGFFPSFFGLCTTIMIMSLGFHYFETAMYSLSLQWFPKEKTPKTLGQIMSAGALATIAAYGLIFLTWRWLELEFIYVYLTGGGLTLAITLYIWLTFPQFEQPVAQRKSIVLRKRYWLYYALTFMSGARRQIFTVFAGFLMVQKFGYSVSDITALYLVTSVFNFFLAPKIGAFIGKWGERRSLILEYSGLIIVFTAYAFIEIAWVAAILFLIDHVFYALMIAMRTYFQKIADPKDLASTAGVAFTINHTSAVILPVILGMVWLANPSAVFLAGTCFAVISLGLAFMVPVAPQPGREFIWSERKAPGTAPAE